MRARPPAPLLLLALASALVLGLVLRGSLATRGAGGSTARATIRQEPAPTPSVTPPARELLAGGSSAPSTRNATAGADPALPVALEPSPASTPEELAARPPALEPRGEDCVREPRPDGGCDWWQGGYDAEGLREGTWVRWSEAWRVREEAHYAHGERVPPVRLWRDDGSLRALHRGLREGRVHGRSTYWHANGRREAELGFENGLEQGVCVWWSEDGQLEGERSGLYFEGRRVRALDGAELAAWR